MKIPKDIAISDSGLVFNPVNGESFSVNPIGIEVINQIREGKSSGEISRAIFTKYMIDPDTIEKDISEFLIILKNFNLLEADGKTKS